MQWCAAAYAGGCVHGQQHDVPPTQLLVPPPAPLHLTQVTTWTHAPLASEQLALHHSMCSITVITTLTVDLSTS